MSLPPVDKPLRVGIAGTGAIAGEMAKTLGLMQSSGDKSAILAAVASRKREKAESFIKENCPGAEAFGSYEEMASAGDIDLAYIATPNQAHAGCAGLFLKHKIACLVEKPFCVNTKEAKELIGLSDKNKVLVTEAIWTRYQPMRQIISDTLKSGIIGDPVFVEANLSYPITAKERLVSPKYAGGALLDLGVYVINFTIMALGHPAQAEMVCVKNSSGCDMSDSITLTFENGRMASLNASAMCLGHRLGAVFGTRGYLTVDNVNNPQVLKIYGSKYELVREIQAPKQLTGFEYEVRECSESIRKGALECPSMPHSETLLVQGIMDTLRAQCGISFPME